MHLTFRAMCSGFHYVAAANGSATSPTAALAEAIALEPAAASDAAAACAFCSAELWRVGLFAGGGGATPSDDAAGGMFMKGSGTLGGDRLVGGGSGMLLHHGNDGHDGNPIRAMVGILCSKASSRLIPSRSSVPMPLISFIRSLRRPP